MARTPESTEERTPESTDNEEELYLPPCRVAAMAIVPCPLCGRQVTTKTLRYSHKCGRTFHAAPREEEQRKLAESAVLARMGQPGERRVEQRQLQAQPLEHRAVHAPLRAYQMEQQAKREQEQLKGQSRYAHLFRH